MNTVLAINPKGQTNEERRLWQRIKVFFQQLVDLFVDTATINFTYSTTLNSFTAEVIDDSITFAKMQNIATDSIIGRATAATGDPENLTALPFAFTGDVTRPADSNAQTIPNDTVTYAKMQNVSAASRVLGRGSAAGSGDVEELTLGSGLIMTGTVLSVSPAVSFIVLYTTTTAVGNVGAGEDDLMSYTTTAGRLAVDGESFFATCSGTFAATADLKRIRAYFGTDAIFDTGTLGITSAAYWSLEVEIIRTGAATQSVTCSFTCSDAALSAYSQYTETTRTLSGTNVIKLTGEAVTNNDIVQKTMKVRWEAAA